MNGTLFGLALLTAAARMVIRFHSQRKLHPDDLVLMFACLTFIASQVLLYTQIDHIHLLGAITFDPSPQTPPLILEDPGTFYRRIAKLQRMEYSAGILNLDIYFCGQDLLFALLSSDDYTTSAIDCGLESNTWNHNIILGFLLCAVFISCPYFGQAVCKSTLPAPSNSAPY